SMRERLEAQGWEISELDGARAVPKEAEGVIATLSSAASPLPRLLELKPPPSSQPGAGAHAGLVGETASMRAIKDTIARLSQSPSTTVLVTGECGSGKDAVARAIHAATARDAPFVYL